MSTEFATMDVSDTPKTTEEPAVADSKIEEDKMETTETKDAPSPVAKGESQSAPAAIKTETATQGAVHKFRCDKCLYATRNKILYDNHTCDNQEEDNGLEEQTLITLKVLEGRRFHCSECDFTAQGHTFEEHLMCHIILRPYQCLYCSQCFVNRKDIGRHVVKHHVGKKMNCALTALKRAKGLMKAALESGSYEFYACIAGKVPLPNDPDKEKSKLKRLKPPVSKDGDLLAKDALKSPSSEAKIAKDESANGVERAQAVVNGNGLQADSESHEESEMTDSEKVSDSAKVMDDLETSGEKETKEGVEAELSSDPVTNTAAHDSDSGREVTLDPVEESSEVSSSDVSKTEDVSRAEENMETDESADQNESRMETEELAAQAGEPTETKEENGQAEGEGAKETEESTTEVAETAATEEEAKADSEEGEKGGSGEGQGEDIEFMQTNFDQSEEEESSVGLKIVATFSLQDGEGKEVGDSCDAVISQETAGDNPEAENDTAEEAEKLAPSATDGLDPRLRSLGPPSKPVPSSSFLGLPPQSDALISRGFAAAGGLVVRRNFFFVCGNGQGCSFSCLTSPEFRDHLMLDHAGESPFHCFHCGFQSLSEDGLVRHISAHAHTYSKSAPLYICGASACKFGSNLVADFVTHQSSWHPDLTAFHCHDCDERFESVDALLKHFEANFLHIINCPHCTAKTTERRTLLNHIASVHPGKPKMVSVAKQIVCRDRKLNNYTQFVNQRNNAVTIISASAYPSHDGHVDHSGGSKNKSLVSILTEPIQPEERELTKQAAAAASVNSVKAESCMDEEDDDDDEDCFDESFDEEEYTRMGQGQGGGEIAYMGSRPDEREADNFKCKFCTFIARDRCRLEGHERCHGLPPSRKSRFKCMYCPQGFNNEHKFSSHVSCHPGLIKFTLFCCKGCEFDSNQRHIIIKHVRNTRDQAHIGLSGGDQEESGFRTLDKTMETRVLECGQCSYMTRHRKHLVQHIKRDHASPRKTGITVDCDIVEKYPSHSLGANRNKALELALSHDRSAALPVGDDGNIKENQARRFKCPICQYLVPRAADLKAHVKRHSEIGEITLVMFRCKYCSAASTAREIIYGHLMEKHLGKQIALVKRIVTIDTRGGDNGYAVTSMEDEEDGVSVDPPQMYHQPLAADGADKLVLLIPDSAGETFSSLMQCPCCAFASYTRRTIIQHVSNHHPEVNIMGRRQDNEVYPLETNYSTPTSAPSGSGSGSGSGSSATSASGAHITLGEALKGEILIVPDSQTFEEPVLCPKCDYATIHRRNIVQHLEQNHPGVSVMGRNDYPTFEGKGQDAVQANAIGKDGMVIIGSGSLDEKVRCLYENYGDRMKCMICQTERPKKFFIHVHLLRHLNILLWGCQFCSHKGLQKYKMMDHIKKVHPGRAFCIRYIPVNVEEKVNDYLRNASVIRARRSGEEGGELASPEKGGSGSGYSSPPQSDSDLNSMRMKYKLSQDKLSSCTIGSEDLDMKLACLYSVGEDNRYRCVVCAQEFQRKFAVHRHIVQTHLKVNLIGCGYCELEGVERHIMMDHIIETHKSAPISMRNLAQNLENRVADFLSKMTLDADAALDLPASDLGLDEDFNFKLPEPPQLPSMLPPLESGGSSASSSPLSRMSPPATPSSSSGNRKNQLNPKLVLLGRDTLHVHLKSLIDESSGGLRCVVCGWDFPRKYAAHRHILMKHLKAGIIGCPYCSFVGVERYQVFTHIKEDHPGGDLSLRYLSLDLDKMVREYLQQVVDGTAELNSKTPPPWSVKKSTKRELCTDDNEEEEEEEEAGDMVEEPGSSTDGTESLVVAMFGKKSGSGSGLGLSIKEEPIDEDEDAYGREPQDQELNGDGDNSIDYDNYVGVMDEADREIRSMSLQAANGTKAKVATDVQTNIRVITIKEKGFKRHICEKCKFTSLHRSNIVRHIYRVHEQYREQECPACNYKTLSRVLIEQHIRNEHPGTSFPQGLPGRAVKRKPELTQEELEQDSMKKCKAAATSKRREADLPLLNSVNTQLYACAYCNFETMTHSEIVQHTRDTHNLAEPMKEAGDRDEEGEEEEGKLKVKLEDAEFETLTKPLKMNLGEVSSSSHVPTPEDTLWQCAYCSYKTSTEMDLKIHFADAHPGSVYRWKRIPTWRFVCRSCHVKTRAHSKMRYHLNRHINYRPYTCTTCGAFYPSPDQCRKHCRANSHNETFTYVKVPRKEKRLQQLLKECQEIALALTKNPAEAESMEVSPSLSQPIPSKRKAKKSFPSVPAKLRKNYEYDAPYSPRTGGSSSSTGATRSEEKSTKRTEVAQMVCASCDFTAQNVCDVWLHFIREHEDQEFQWMDLSTGHICTETGEITNAKDAPPDLDAPPGPGYSMLSNRMLSCERCEFTTSTVQAMKSHLRRHLPKRYLCPYCSLRCSRRDTINQHVRCGHRGRELWTIFFRLPEGFLPDGEESSVTTDLAEPQVTFETDGDGDAPTQRSSPIMSYHGVSERIKCGNCDVRLESVASVHEHHEQEHPDLDFLWVDSTNGYTCNYAGEVTDAREQSPHLFSQDGFSVESANSSIPTFCCRFCPFTSAFIQAIKSHMKSHLPHGFMCPYCCMATNSKEKMVSHQSCTHREQESWVLHLRMPIDSTASSASNSTSAAEKNCLVMQSQRGVTSYKCNKCDFASESLYKYRMHLANHGNGSRNKAKDTPPQSQPVAPEDQSYRCGYCPYLAQDEGDFGAHIASHLERGNFQCSKCSYTAVKRSAIEMHIQSTHDESEEIQVIDLKGDPMVTLADLDDPEEDADAVTSDVDKSSDELQLVNLDPKVTVTPVNDLDLDREGLTLFSPPSSPGGTSHREEGENRESGIIGLAPPTDMDDQSDSTEEWGGQGRGEESPNVSEQSRPQRPGGNLGGGGSILRLTLQGKLTGEYGIKRAVPADLDHDASASRDSLASGGDNLSGDEGEDGENGSDSDEGDNGADNASDNEAADNGGSEDEAVENGSDNDDNGSDNDMADNGSDNEAVNESMSDSPAKEGSEEEEEEAEEEA